MSKKESRSSKRQLIREQRQRRERQKRLALILGISAVALVVVALLVIPNILAASAPVGEIKVITPVARPTADGLALGDPNAPVTVEVFEDFQCPMCDQYSQQIEPQIVQNDVATGKVHYIFRQYPFLDTGKPGQESHKAANASMCANEQGRFWDYHDMLFANWNGENEGNFSDKRLIAFAEALNLDMNQFRQCYNENRYQAEIQADLERGKQLGVTGTPSVFVNEQIVAPGYVPTYDQIQAAIQAAQPSQ
jgi:protein-disulfide isomerase